MFYILLEIYVYLFKYVYFVGLRKLKVVVESEEVRSVISIVCSGFFFFFFVKFFKDGE